MVTATFTPAITIMYHVSDFSVLMHVPATYTVLSLILELIKAYLKVSGPFPSVVRMNTKVFVIGTSPLDWRVLKNMYVLRWHIGC